MAKVKGPEPTIHEYWRRYWRRTLFLAVCMQIIAVLIVATALLLVGLADPSHVSFWIMLSTILVAVIGINISVLGVVTEPLKQLTAALAKTNGEETNLIPPNPNTRRYASSGLKPLLQAIYSLGASTTGAKELSTDTQAPFAPLVDIFNSASAGIALLDEEGKVVLNSKQVPVSSTSGKSRLDLLFYTDTTIEDWLKECKKSAVHAEKSWQHIASKPSGEEGRQIFDIVASYNKGSKTPVVVLLIDKTAEYLPEDDDLNFIAFAAHELRGPITVVRGYLDVLNDELEEVTSDEQKELFDRLIVSASQLSGYVNNILNSARYDRRHLRVRLIETTINDIYKNIADDMQLRAATQRRLLHVDFPNDLPTIAADPTSIGEVLSNLIDNAIKYSSYGGTIEVSAEVQDSHLEVSVKDHGIGIPANVMGNLFHKFYRSHRSRETVAGTGIGLYISKAIIESHDGTIEVKSIEGEGSRFTFTLPLYASVADKLKEVGGDNKTMINNRTGSWIRNHGSFRG